MTADDDRLLDPDRVATRGFSGAFRGFDQQEVRAFLEELATALRSKRDNIPGLTALAADADAAATEREELEARVAELETELAALESADAEAARQPAAPTEFDEASMTALLGTETMRVLETARQSAKQIEANAVAEAEARTKELEVRESTLEAELERRRKEFEESFATLKKTAEAEAETTRREATEFADSTRKEAKDEAERERKAAAEEATEVRAKAKEETVRIRSEADEAATKLRTNAEEAAAALRAEAEADASGSQDQAREQARLMLTEAQAVREKVLADLVKRRRLGRQQFDQVKAARDRLARSLAVVRKELDEAMSELVTAVPEARAAMEAVGRRVPESSDTRQAADLAVELDTARVAGIPIPGMADSDDDDDDGEPMPDIDELFDRIKTADGTKSSASSTPAASTPDASPGSAKGDAPKSDPANESQGAMRDSAGASGTAAAAVAEKPTNSGSSASSTSLGSNERTAKKAAKKTSKKPASTKPASKSPKPAKATEGTNSTAALATDPKAANLADADSTDDSSAENEGTEASDGEAARTEQVDGLLQAFVERDVALTRFGPDLKRQLKRALADDQSEILDRLRQARKISISDLPDPKVQTGAYVDALQSAVASAAKAGASHAGGTCPDGVVDELVRRVATDLTDPLRQKVERVVGDAGGNKDEALDPIRALYRDLRSNELPETADDALAEAFAVGVYEALSDGTVIEWIGDPRVEAGPDCYDNTLAGSVTKPDAFPTGHHRPPGSPGCRCLVVKAD